MLPRPLHDELNLTFSKLLIGIEDLDAIDDTVGGDVDVHVLADLEQSHGQLKLERGADVLFSGKRSLKEVPWSMLLHERVDDVSAPEKEEPIGVLSYLGEVSSEVYNYSPEGCHIEAVINQDIFNALLSAIQAGRLPDVASINVSGLKYGSDLDGREKIWNVKTHENAPVTNVSFGIGMIASNTSEDSSSSESIGHLPASGADIGKLQSHITDQIALLTRTVWTATAFLGAILLVWIFRH